MSFRSVFVAIVIGFALIVSAFLINNARPRGCQALVGLIGFALHGRAVLRQPGPTWFEQLLTGAPPMAPLLFPNLVILGLIGLWVLAAPERQRR